MRRTIRCTSPTRHPGSRGDKTATSRTAFPDKAIDVIDEAGARMRIRNMTLPKELRDLDDKLREVRSKKDKAIGAQDFETAAELRDKESKLKTEREQAEEGRKYTLQTGVPGHGEGYR